MGLVVLAYVLLGGLSINGYNAAQAGHPVESVGDFKHAVVAEYYVIKARPGFVSYKLND